VGRMESPIGNCDCTAVNYDVHLNVYIYGCVEVDRMCLFVVMMTHEMSGSKDT
jgi:hypothetical protein